MMNTLEYDLKTLRTTARCGALLAIANAIDAAIAEAVKAEREACAVVATDCPTKYWETGGDLREQIADAIRARGNPPPKVRPAPPPPPPSPRNVIISEGSRRIVGRGNP